MKAMVIEHFGEPTLFQPADVPAPEVIPGHILIRVAATSVNPVDMKIREGIVADIAPECPAILHGDVAGVIEAVGDGVDKFKVGNEVYGCAGGVKGTGGALAEYMLADARLVAHKPQSLTMVEAAALPLVSITAWEGLIDRAQVQTGHQVLVYGGTGGVGHIAVQLAKWAGATVYTTASSPGKVEIARQLGADGVIDYRKQWVEEYVNQYTNGKGFDVVLDTVGNDHLQTAFKAAALNGVVVSLVSLSQQDLTLLHAKGLTLHLVFMLIPLLHNTRRAYHGDILSKLARLVDSGIVRPLIDAEPFRFEDVALAHQRAASGQAIGKVVLTRSLCA
jgi:NADPH:quinone reductase